MLQHCADEMVEGPCVQKKQTIMSSIGNLNKTNELMATLLGKLVS